MKRVADPFLTEPRSTQQSCHLTKPKLIIPTTPLQQQKPNNLIQSLNGLCKFFNQKEETKQITIAAPKSIQRSSASLSPRQISSVSNSSPLLVKQLLYGKKEKENLNPKQGMFSITEFKQPELVRINDSSHKKSMGKLGLQKSRNASVQYHEDWKQKYEDLQESLCKRIQQLENELEDMEENRKIDQMHSDEQANQYIEQLQSIIQEKDQHIYHIEQRNHELQRIIERQQKEITKYREEKHGNQEIKRLLQVDQQFQRLKGQLPSLQCTVRNIQQIIENGTNNLSLSSVSMVEMINELNEVESNRKSQQTIQVDSKSLNISDIISKKQKDQ